MNFLCISKMFQVKESTSLINKNFIQFLRAPFFAVCLFMGGCISSGTVVTVQKAAPIPVDSGIVADAEVAAIIAPYKEKLSAEMNEVIGYARKELSKGPVESALGNFVADLLEDKAEQYASVEVDMGAITIGGLRVPIPEGPITVRDMYELMPFENMVWVLELSGEQTLQLFQYAAKQKMLAISGSKLVIENDQPVYIEINGKPFSPEEKYTLAISDYLANGGDQMTFLKDAERLVKLDVKLRDVIIEKVTDLHTAGKKVNAEIEGRVVVQE